MARRVVLYTDEENFWVAECPSLPGCNSQGDSREQAIENIKDAIKGYIEAMKEDDLPVPTKDDVEILVLDV